MLSSQKGPVTGADRCVRLSETMANGATVPVAISAQVWLAGRMHSHGTDADIRRRVGGRRRVVRTAVPRHPLTARHSH